MKFRFSAADLGFLEHVGKSAPHIFKRGRISVYRHSAAFRFRTGIAFSPMVRRNCMAEHPDVVQTVKMIRMAMRKKQRIDFLYPALYRLNSELRSAIHKDMAFCTVGIFVHDKRAAPGAFIPSVLGTAYGTVARNARNAMAGSRPQESHLHS